MFTRNISTSCEMQACMTNQAVVANTAVTVTAAMIVDMAGYQSVTFIAVCAAGTAANTPVLSAASTPSATNTTNTAIANTSVPVGANTTVQVLELSRPAKRFICPIVTGGAVNSTVSVVAILTGREPQNLGNGNPADNMNPGTPTFNTTTAVWTSVMQTQSALNTPTSKLLLANP